MDDSSMKQVMESAALTKLDPLLNVELSERFSMDELTLNNSTSSDSSSSISWRVFHASRYFQSTSKAAFDASMI
jgi:hypothetical protein